MVAETGQMLRRVGGGTYKEPSAGPLNVSTWCPHPGRAVSANTRAAGWLQQPFRPAPRGRKRKKPEKKRDFPRRVPANGYWGRAKPGQHRGTGHAFEMAHRAKLKSPRASQRDGVQPHHGKGQEKGETTQNFKKKDNGRSTMSKNEIPS